MAKQQTTSINKKAEMIYCERCGEDYSATYRRCPFCDERPGRRIDDRGTRGPLQVAVLVVTLIMKCWCRWTPMLLQDCKRGRCITYMLLHI